MVIFHSYVSLPEGTSSSDKWPDRFAYWLICVFLFKILDASKLILYHAQKSHNAQESDLLLSAVFAGCRCSASLSTLPSQERLKKETNADVHSFEVLQYMSFQFIYIIYILCFSESLQILCRFKERNCSIAAECASPETVDQHRPARNSEYGWAWDGMGYNRFKMTPWPRWSFTAASLRFARLR